MPDVTPPPKATGAVPAVIPPAEAPTNPPGADLAGVQERLRAAEVERAAAVARAEEAWATAAAERRARRRTRALAVALLALVAVGAGGGLWVQHRAAERRADEARQQQRVESALEKAAALCRQARWGEARAALGQTRQMLGEAAPDDLRHRLDVAVVELTLVSRLDAIRQRRATRVEGRFDDPTAARDYAAVIGQAGLGDVSDDETVVAARVRDSAVSGQLVAALDDWACVATDPKMQSWLLGVARRAAPDPWGDRFRDPAVWGDRRALQALADDALRDDGAQLDQLSPQVLGALGRLLGGGAAALPLLRAAQRRYPNDFWLNLELAQALGEAKHAEEALGYHRAAVALRPDAGAAHYNLGNALREKKDLDGAVAEFRTAFDIDPQDAGAPVALGLVLLQQGRFIEARTATRRGLELFPEGDPMRPVAWQQLQQCERLHALDEKLPAVLSGEAEPGDGAERIALGHFCQLCKHRHAAAARFFAEAFAADPQLAADLTQPHRYNAACSAALAAAGQGEDARNLPDKVSLMLRQQALGWLRADLAQYAKLAEREAAAKQVVRQLLGRWPQEPDFTSVRDPDGLARLPRAERQEWRELWDDVAALLAQAGAAP